MSNSFGPEDIKGISALGPAQGLGCSIVASLLVFILGGVFLDQYLDTAPLLTLIGVAIGLAAAGYQLYELTLINRTDRASGPIGRTLESKLQPRRRGSPEDEGDSVQ